MIQLRLGLLGAGLLCFAPLSLAIGRSPLADSTDVLISNTPYERENAVSVSPLNPNSVLVANNGGAGGVTAWTSVDGGVTWSTNGSFAFGDPATAIIANPAYGQHGRFVVLALGLALAKVEVNYKDQIAQNWSSRIVTELGPADKGHIWVDNSPHSGSLRFRTYAAWMRGTRQIVVATSLDGGDNWSEAEIPHTNPTPTSQTSWGANVHTGRTGRVYVVWPRRTAGSTDQAETKAFGFSEMLTVDPLAFQMEIVLLDNLVSEANDVVPSDAPTFPSMAVDRSEEAQDRLLVVWAQRVASNQCDIMMMKGAAALQPSGPVVWEPSSLVRVNSTSGPGVLHWWPWITWDECTDMLAIVFMEKIESNVNARVAVSKDLGVTWNEFSTSDLSWSGQRYDGYDYIGISSADGRGVPVWSDNRGDSPLRPYTSPFLLWGVDQQSVTVTVATNFDRTLRMTANWNTNLEAKEGDEVTFTPPTGPPITSPTTPGAAGLSHSVSMNVPCAHGTWKVTVTSRRALPCKFKRTSDEKTFLVEPFAAGIVPPSVTASSRGVAWGDYDNDGKQDLYVVYSGGTNKLLRNTGWGAFTDVTPATLADVGAGNAAAWGDFDNDGDLDLYLAKGNLQANRLFQNDGSGAFMDVTSGPLGGADDSRAVSWVDYDRDRNLDLFIANHNTSNRLLRNTGCGTFVDVTAAAGLGDVGPASATAWADYDNDGDVDAYVVKVGDGFDINGANKLYRNNGNGTFTEMVFVAEDRGDGQSAAWGDYDNDGKLDLCVINNTHASKLYHNDGGGVFSTPHSLPFLDSGAGLAWGDYDNDGKLDLYLNNSGVNQLLRNNGGGVWTEAVTGPSVDPGDGRGVAWADQDGDGKLDLYIANNGQTNKVLQSLSCSTNHWLRVKLEGTESNRSAIGARVRLVTGSLKQTRHVDGGSGYGSQNSLPLEFGLGTATSVDTLWIAWPSGIIQTMAVSPVDREISVVEPCPTTTADPVTTTMTGWADGHSDPAYMTVHFSFKATWKAQQFKVRYQPEGGNWTEITCASPSSNCKFNCDGTYEVAIVWPCEQRKFFWQAKGMNCVGWTSAWVPGTAKTFTTYCLQEP